MESDTESLSSMLLEMSPDSPPPGDAKKRAWPRRLQIPLGILFVGSSNFTHQTSCGGGRADTWHLKETEEPSRTLERSVSPAISLTDTIGGPMPGKDPWEPDILDIILGIRYPYENAFYFQNLTEC